MSRPNATKILSRAFLLWCGVVAVAALYFARDVLLPLALAILLTFLLAPLVTRLEAWRIRRIPAVLIVVTFAVSLLGILGYSLASQMYDLAQQLPKYKENIVAKVEALQIQDNSLFQRGKQFVDDIGQRISRAPPPTPVKGGTPAPKEKTEQSIPSDQGVGQEGRRDGRSLLGAADRFAKGVQPVPVEIVNEHSHWQLIQSILGPLISPLGTAALVFVFVVFMLIERESLRNRLIDLIGSRQLNLATQAIDDAAYRVSRYLMMQVIVNTLFGLVIGIGLFIIGLPNAFLWGVLAAALRFLPYVGAWIAAAIPIALAAAVFPGWTRPVLVLALFIVNELISNNVLEPWLYGSSTGISTVGILISAVFWTWLWGPIGLVLATPLTVCLMVLARYVPDLAFINRLLSEDDPLSPDARFYQRLLAMDPEEGTDVAEEYLKDNSLEALYDNVLLPALSLAEQDRHQGDLDQIKQRFILQTMRELVDDLGVTYKASANAKHRQETSADPQAAAAGTAPVLCLPARDEADEIAGIMLAQLLQARGVTVTVVSTQVLTGEMLARVEEQPTAVVCISALPPLAATHARYLCKRLRQKFPSLKIVVGLWQTARSTKKAQTRLMETGVDRFVTTLADASDQLAHAVASAQLLDTAPEVEPEHSPQQ